MRKEVNREESGEDLVSMLLQISRAMPSMSLQTHSCLIVLVDTLLRCLCSIRVRVALDHSVEAVLDEYEICNVRRAAMQQ